MTEEISKWELPSPGKMNPTMFVGDKEKNLQKQVADEIVERFINQVVIYYPIDIQKTQYHPIYGEALNKKFHSPIEVKCMVEWSGMETANEGYTVDRVSSILVHFHKRRINEDLEMVVRVGDYLAYGRNYYEITKLDEDRRVFGAHDLMSEVTATCIKTRRGLFEVNEGR